MLHSWVLRLGFKSELDLTTFCSILLTFKFQLLHTMLHCRQSFPPLLPIHVFPAVLASQPCSLLFHSFCSECSSFRNMDVRLLPLIQISTPISLKTSGIGCRIQNSTPVWSSYPTMLFIIRQLHAIFSCIYILCSVIHLFLMEGGCSSIHGNCFSTE